MCSNLLDLSFCHQDRPCILCGKREGPRKKSGGRNKAPKAPASRAVANLAELPYDHLKGLGFCHSRSQQPGRISQKKYAELPYAPHVAALRMEIHSQVCERTSYCIFHIQHQRCTSSTTAWCPQQPPQKCYNKCLQIDLSIPSSPGKGRFIFGLAAPPSLGAVPSMAACAAPPQDSPPPAAAARRRCRPPPPAGAAARHLRKTPMRPPAARRPSQHNV